jgi:flavin-dependent dehydrogenase
VRVVIIGGGVAGLGTALACARDGHQVTVLERDDTPMPRSADAAFEWNRTGAPQVRHSHAFLARLRLTLAQRAPDVLAALHANGATDQSFTETLPPTMTDHDPRPGDDELIAMSCRRTTFEWVVRSVVMNEPGVEWHGGVGVDGLDARNGRVVGVAGFDADLVVDARGPRSSSDAWLAALGARPVPEELHESGIVYFSRFYRLAPGAVRPPFSGPVAADTGYLKFAIFGGDNDTFSITYAVDTHDDELRKAFTDPAVFEAAALQLLPVAPWRAPGLSEPINDVHVMAGLRNRNRPFVVEGAPLLTGFVPVGDAAVCTNPLHGRGCSLAFVHAYGLADALREHGDDLDEFARAYADFTDRELVPWFHSAKMQDEQARMQAAGEELSPEDPRAFIQQVVRDGLLPAVRTSPTVFRAFLRWLNLLSQPEDLMADPAVVAEVMTAYENRDSFDPPEPFAPARRAEFVAALPR